MTEVPVYRPVEPPTGYREAVEAGTRSADGTPGPAYWQQEVDYRIRAELLPEEDRVRGRATVTYVNRSPDTLARLHLNLYQNVFSEGVRRNRRVEVTGGIELGSVRAAGRELERVPGDELVRRLRRRTGGGGGDGEGIGGGEDAAAPEPAYSVRGTMGAVLLPRPLAPGDSVELRLRWSFRVPGPEAFRMGRIGSEVYDVAQWYPQVATYDDVDGHYTEPYLGDGEFYLEYGTFDVQLTVPEGWLVGATGVLRNPAEVLAPAVRRRLEAASSADTVIRVVAADQRGAGSATVDAQEDRLTWRFRGERLRDFAFVASPRYVWDAVAADVGGEQGTVTVHALYDPSVEHWSEAARYSRHALEFFSDYIRPYPYPQATAGFGPVGGMEYPMLVFIGRSGPGERLYSVLAHELSHEWFPMMVGSREGEFAWMDEGLTTFNEALAREDFFEESGARLSDMRSYLAAARRDGVEAPLMRHTDYVRSGFGRVVAAYTKPATVLHALRTVVGEDVFDRAYRRYAEAWAWRHPLPWDFFNVVEAEAGRDLDWFWRPWFYGTATLDQALEDVRRAGDGLRVTVSNLGGAVMPVLLEVETAAGETVRRRWPASVWAGTRTVTRTVELEGRPVRVTLDPDRRFPDVDDANDEWKP